MGDVSDTSPDAGHEGEADTLITLFRACVVRVDDGQGTFRGTGFFVSPGTVLTCADVRSTGRFRSRAGSGAGRLPACIAESGQIPGTPLRWQSATPFGSRHHCSGDARRMARTYPSVIGRARLATHPSDNGTFRTTEPGGSSAAAQALPSGSSPQSAGSRAAEIPDKPGRRWARRPVRPSHVFGHLGAHRAVHLSCPHYSPVVHPSSAIHRSTTPNREETDDSVNAETDSPGM